MNVITGSEVAGSSRRHQSACRATARSVVEVGFISNPMKRRSSYDAFQTPSPRAPEAVERTSGGDAKNA